MSLDELETIAKGTGAVAAIAGVIVAAIRWGPAWLDRRSAIYGYHRLVADLREELSGRIDRHRHEIDELRAELTACEVGRAELEARLRGVERELAMRR